MNPLQHQTYSPSTCDCVIEQLVDYSQEPAVVTLWFFHKVCAKHEPLVKNKKTLKAQDLDKKRKQIIDHHKLLLKENRERHLRNFDEHESRKNMKARIADMKMSLVSEEYALKLEAKMQAERINTERFLDDHEEESMLYMMNGLYSPYSLVSEDVYNAVFKEQAEANPIIENDIDN